jgi:hypothetical protein
MLEKLGFVDPSIMEVKITPGRKGAFGEKKDQFRQIDYVFNTHVMKPPESSATIREWK